MCRHRLAVVSNGSAQRSLTAKPWTDRSMGELEDLTNEWHLTLGTVSDEFGKVYGGRSRGSAPDLWPSRSPLPGATIPRW
jgi:hypothetical protein